MAVSVLHIDTSSIRSLSVALTRRDSLQWSDWELRAASEVTLGLLFYEKMCFPPSRLTGAQSNFALFDIPGRILKDFVVEGITSREQREQALAQTRAWVSENTKAVKEQYERLKQDPSCLPFLQWAVAYGWEHHLHRFGNLIGMPMLDEIASVLQWSPREKKEVRKLAGELQAVKAWSEICRDRQLLPDEHFVDAYLLSGLVRGRYYQYLADSGHASHIWHPFRNYALQPVTELCETRLASRNLCHIYLAGMICCGAMLEHSDDEIIGRWAENIRLLKHSGISVPSEPDDVRARKKAVEIAKQSNLEFRHGRLSSVLDCGVEKIIGPIFSIVAGTFGSHVAGYPGEFAGHVAGETFPLPFVQRLQPRVKAMVRTADLKRLAKRAQRVFVVTKRESGEPLA